MPLPPSRPELSGLLLEAVRRRDATATARLTRQWAHRHGVVSLERFRRCSVIVQQGTEAGDWLRQQVEGAAGGRTTAGMDDAFAALEAAFSTPLACAGEAPATTPATAFELAPEPAPRAKSLPEASHLSVLSTGTTPAPAPPTLADLRSWLSGAPQHRRAS